MPCGVAENVFRRRGALTLRERAAKQKQQRRNVACVAAEAHVEPVRELDRAFAAKLGIPICTTYEAPVAMILSSEWWNDGTWREV